MLDFQIHPADTKDLVIDNTVFQNVYRTYDAKVLYLIQRAYGEIEDIIQQPLGMQHE